MKVSFDEFELRPLIERVVAETLAKIEAHQLTLDGRIALTGPEAAALLGVRPHVLRDARLRGELIGSRLGKRIVYKRDELIQFLMRNRTG